MARAMSSDEIRETFLGFFTSRRHARIEAASLVPRNDPTLLYVNAGMAPLKPYFLGEAIPPAPDLCNVQPCLRTVDIGEVGDRHHLTFFEMLGSWSIGNYGPQRAVELAFELLTAGFGFSVGELYVTVFGGDDTLGVPADEESVDAWRRAGIPDGHIVRLGAEDNFWSAGETGPCGPSTEVFYDTGPQYGAQYQPGGHFDSARRYIEIWNAGVFMRYNRLPGGRLEPLRFSSVDTGSGLERMSMVLQGCESAYESDLLAPVVGAAVAAVGGGAGQRDIRVIADHLRAATFILGEGVAPSNEGGGYIPRRLMRKALATAALAGRPDADLTLVADAVIDRMSGAYPMLRERRGAIIGLLAAEQHDFGQLVRRGLDRLAALASGSDFVISGDDAFALFATHGMPVDLIRDFATGQGGSVDEERLAELLARHRELSRGPAPASTGEASGGPAALPQQLAADLPAGPTSFLGHQQLAADAEVLAVAVGDHLVPELTAGQRGLMVADQTPCYAEGGGQIGDTGEITGPGLTALVTDTRQDGGRHVHHIEVIEGTLRPGQRVTIAVDAPRRAAIVRNHSATHLLQAALRLVLGEHVRQAGSLVAPDRLRFDFEHPAALSADQADEVERLVNAEILANLKRDTTVRPYQEAITGGAIAFFGDRYDSDVRVVSFGDFSAELCGGTHVHGTAEVGLFLIVSEGSIGAGVRRIEAVTGEAALQRALERDHMLRGLAAQLRVPVSELPERVTALTAAARRPASRGAGQPAGDALAGAVRTAPSGKRYLVIDDPGIDPSELARRAQQISAELGAVVAMLLLGDGDSTQRIGISVPAHGADADARQLLRDVLAATGGRGGGSASFAQGGLSGPADRPALLARLWDVLGRD
ncbi:MAG TPA: alanine--tRNA ligase [Streptosporangiaceae bacterium]|jgi:alanyl-tRNA synthetase